MFNERHGERISESMRYDICSVISFISVELSAVNEH